MPLSREMREQLVARFAAICGAAEPVRTVGPDLRCETVEDAERLVLRLAAWRAVCHELGAVSVLEEDRAVFAYLEKLWGETSADLAAAIRATREDGVPWEETQGIVAAREVAGGGTIDPGLVVATEGDLR